MTSARRRRGSAACLRAYNLLDLGPAQERCHHPVFHLLATRGLTFPRVPNTVREETGLLVPWEFDCAAWNLSSCAYHAAVHSRALRCEEQRAAAALRLPAVDVRLPAVDEEYPEMVAVYTAALAARGPSLHVVEIGARWGMWGGRAGAALRALNPMPASILFYEPEASADGVDRVMALNGVPRENYTLVRAKADAASLGAWAARVPHVDLVNADIQGGEAGLVPHIIKILNAKALRLVVGTHGAAIHAKLLALLEAEGWRVLHSVGFMRDAACVARSYRAERDFAGVLARGCYANTTWGPVCQWDGEIIADNPRLVDGAAPPAPACLHELRL